VQAALEAREPARDFGPLRRQVGVVELLDVPGDRQRGLATGQHLTAKEPEALRRLFDRGPVEQRLEHFPVVVELRLEVVDTDPLFRAGHQGAQLQQRGHVVAPELRQALAVIRCVLALGIEQIVTDEDARQVHVGAEPAQPGIDLTMMRVERLELVVDLVGAPRGSQHRDDDHQQQCREPDRRNGPGPEQHTSPPARPARWTHRIQRTRTGASGALRQRPEYAGPSCTVAAPAQFRSETHFATSVQAPEGALESRVPERHGIHRGGIS
jgi:hypothetical protein